MPGFFSMLGVGLAVGVAGAAAEAPIPIPAPPRPVVREAVAAAGIRVIPGRYVTLYTDLPSDPDVDGLPAVFDLAVPSWCAYFGIEPETVKRWRMHAFLIGSKERFDRAGLIPADLPPFRHGFARGGDLWLYEQPTLYYRRHLLLHEGTHGFMQAVFGGCGPPWYMEGTAELLATHSYRDGRLTLRTFPADRQQVPMWGRIRMIRDAVAAGRTLSLDQVLTFGPRAHLENEPYAWCWAAAALLDRHPRYRERFQTLPKFCRAPNFNAEFRRLYAADWRALNDEWQLFVSQLDYGHDVQRVAIDFAPGQPVRDSPARGRVAADRGWQNTGFRLAAGHRYEISATGRFQVADRPKPWWCEPPGVTIRYVDGRPLGLLLAAVRPDGDTAAPRSALLDPIAVGERAVVAADRDGTLFLRINDSPAELSDNQGEIEFTLSAL